MGRSRVLEPDEGKLSRPVLRGLGASNGPRLLGEQGRIYFLETPFTPLSTRDWPKSIGISSQLHCAKLELSESVQGRPSFTTTFDDRLSSRWRIVPWRTE